MMVELLLGDKPVGRPYLVRLPGITEEVFEEMVDEDTRAELLDGVMIVHSPATTEHDDLGGFLRGLLRVYTRRKRLGKTLGPDAMVHLATCRKFAPDAFFVAQERLPRPMPKKEFEGAPDFILEILSPSNRDYDLGDKRDAYHKAGVREIWFLDPETQELLIDRKQKRGYRTTQHSEGRVESSVVPGFWIELTWLQQEELPDDRDCQDQLLNEGGKDG